MEEGISGISVASSTVFSSSLMDLTLLIRCWTRSLLTSSIRRKILLRLLLMLSWISWSCIWTKSWTVSDPSMIQKLLKQTKRFDFYETRIEKVRFLIHKRREGAKGYLLWNRVAGGRRSVVGAGGGAGECRAAM